MHVGYWIEINTKLFGIITVWRPETKASLWLSPNCLVLTRFGTRQLINVVCYTMTTYMSPYYNIGMQGDTNRFDTHFHKIMEFSRDEVRYDWPSWYWRLQYKFIEPQLTHILSNIILICSYLNHSEYTWRTLTQNIIVIIQGNAFAKLQAIFALSLLILKEDEACITGKK